ncbi:SusC/RagA family TonB-linked outer membrane protein [Bacteroides sp.]|uniref:SusC/RagA family TonB-linked outer membrane protein n=1 Tax=Bacteroides sp. TaxID=29523 RepID=UPI002589E636|nr:SusC/RagA family TonB-linked outer membrane protein [Bacteroides sp.]
MKLLFVFLFAGMLSISASTYSQSAKVSIKLKNATVSELFDEIRSQTPYSFWFNANDVDINQTVQINAVDKTVKDVLEQALSKQALQVSLNGNHIVLTKKAVLSQGVNQNTRKITGSIKDQNGEAIIGASIQIDGLGKGSISDLDGNFTLEVIPGNKLIFSYIGYTTQQVTIKDQTHLNIILKEDSEILEEVVVTALGIKRAEKALSYNVQEVKADDVTLVKDANFVNSLSGKIAGVNINSSSTGIGGATRVVMRGTKSITKSNNAMYVIDGIPIMNNNGGALEENNEYNKQPGGEGISDLNPEDIESMTVLSGASAAALYGSDAANGAIIITTKKGKRGAPQITFSNQTTFSKPLIMPEFQNKYGNRPLSYDSWGDERPSNISAYNPKDFFDTGTNVITSLNLSVGSDKNQTYASISNNTAQGIVPNNNFEKNNLTLRNTTSFLNDKLELDFSIRLIKQKDKNMLAAGQYFNPLIPIYTFPRGEDFSKIRMFESYDTAREIYTQNWGWDDQALSMQNPYWMTERNLQENKRTRYMLNASMKYQATDWLNLSLRMRRDESNNDFTRKLNASTIRKFSGENGFYEGSKQKQEQSYLDFMATADKRFAQDFSIFATVGASIFDNRYSEMGGRGPLGLVPNFFSLKNIDYNGKDGDYMDERWHEQTQSIFGSAELGWKSMLYFSVTARNDWASALANTNKSSFFYPSVGLSGVISEMVDLPSFITFMKVRASYASVGSAVPRNISIFTYDYKGKGAWGTDTTRPIGELKPERTGSWELGLNTRLFQDMVNIDLTLYKSITKNQTFLVPISASSMYKSMYIQSGSVENKGLEGLISFNKKWGDFSWNSSFTASYNANKVKELVDNYVDPETGESISLDKYSGGGTGSLEVILKKGGTMGDLWTKTALAKDQNGYVYIDPNTGAPVIESNKEQKVGSVLPKWNLGFQNEFTWKDLSFSFLVTARLGGVVASPTQAILDGMGVSKATQIARENGGIPINSGEVSAETWYKTIGQGGVHSYYIYSANNVRLKEASITYKLKPEWFNNKVRLSVSLVGSNLWMIYNKAPFDPELTSSTGTYFQGIDYFMQPSLRNIGFSVRAQF